MAAHPCTWCWAMNAAEPAVSSGRQAADAVLDVELVLAHHGGSALPEQLVVVEQTASDGVLDGADADDGRISLDVLKHLLESSATD